MKKHLLLGSAMLAAISAYPQSTPEKRQHAPVENISAFMSKRLASLSRIDHSEAQMPVSSEVIPQVSAPEANLRTNNVGPVNWHKFTGSMNMYGVLLSESKPLQYDDELNAVTFVHRKSNTYVPSPLPSSAGANSGVLVAMVSQNWGAHWDSTMIYNDNNNWARYPQGGILKGGLPASPFNTDIANAFIVATAPITPAAGDWTGNVFVSKSLGAGTYNNIQSQSSQTFVANSPPYTAWNGMSAKMQFVRQDFQSTDDGKVRALGSITDAGPTSSFRGARMVTGSFVSGSIAWVTDSIIPPVRPNISGGGRMLAYPTGMAWSEDGQTGYVWFIGAHTGVVGDTTGANIGYQPIIARSIDAGTSWTWQSIDFNHPSFKAPVLDHIESTAANPNLTVPYFNFWEGISGVVDSLRNLHLVSMVVRSPAANDPDSVNYYQKYINYDGETYFYPHEPGARPYLYDFHGGSPNTPAYSVTLIDSLGTEGPSDETTGDGYAANPWMPTVAEDNLKIPIDCRIQASRTANGRYIIYSWAETDTVYTTNNIGYMKWNVFPNVKARMCDIKTHLLSPTEINVSKLIDASGGRKMANKSYNHYISQKCAVDVQLSSYSNVVIKVPHTISFNTSLDPVMPATHWYASVPLEFQNYLIFDSLAVQSHQLNSVSNSFIYPNPATNNALLAIELNRATTIKISIVNVLGQVVKNLDAKSPTGANTIGIDLNGLSKGIYLVNIDANGASATKKLIVE
ncbi:MAG: T9SS type A sorting domain-containing protein [Bacteroidota bacterium]